MSEPVNAILGDSREVLRTFADNSFDSCVCDPPYALVSIVKRFGNATADDVYKNAELRKTFNQGKSPYARAASGFMGQKWDTGETAFDPAFWTEVLRVLKPGAHLFAFSGTRTYHRMVCAIEDAGFEVRDQFAWTFGSGFPKSYNLDGEWEGWGTAAKPAWEPICLARKPLSEKTVAANVLRWGCGALNIDGCRVETAPGDYATGGPNDLTGTGWGHKINTRTEQHPAGRWPANLILEGDEHGNPVKEVLAGFPETGVIPPRGKDRGPSTDAIYGAFDQRSVVSHGDSGSAARFFYCAKADSDDRLGSRHPTVKPVDLMAYLVRLVTRRGGTVLDPFAGTGTTGEAAIREGCKAVLIEREPAYYADIQQRMKLALAGPEERARAIVKASGKLEPIESLPLFVESK